MVTVSDLTLLAMNINIQYDQGLQLKLKALILMGVGNISLHWCSKLSKFESFQIQAIYHAQISLVYASCFPDMKAF